MILCIGGPMHGRMSEDYGMFMRAQVPLRVDPLCYEPNVVPTLDPIPVCEYTKTAIRTVEQREVVYVYSRAPR